VPSASLLAAFSPATREATPFSQEATVSSATALADLERISVGEASPKEAIIVLRGLWQDGGEDLGPRVYTTLKALTLKILTARRRSELAEWTDVIRQASALVKRRGEESFGERLLTLSDLTTDWMRTADEYSIKQLFDRPHVRTILQTIQDVGGQAKRTQVLAKTGIGEANLSRILGSLETVGLIERDNRRERTITLTAEADRYLRPAEARPLPPESSRENAVIAAAAAGMATAKAAVRDVVETAERLTTAAQEHISEAAAAVSDRLKAHRRSVEAPTGPSLARGRGTADTERSEANERPNIASGPRT
jgi:predicted transcriptional regulator